MKKLALLLIITCILTIANNAYAQESCYQATRLSGIYEMNQKKWRNAISFFEQAILCPDKPADNDLNILIAQCENRIRDHELYLQNKEEEERIKKQEELRLQMERDSLRRVERIAFLKDSIAMERIYEEKGYIDSIKVEITKTDAHGNATSEYIGSYFGSKEVKEVQVIISYKSLVRENKVIKLEGVFSANYRDWVGAAKKAYSFTIDLNNQKGVYIHKIIPANLSNYGNPFVFSLLYNDKCLFTKVYNL